MASPKIQSSATAVCVRVGGRELRLSPGTYTLGRHHSCDIVLESTLVSRRHAQLGVTRTTAVLTDLGSSNGVYVNGERVVGTVSLRNGDRVLLGDQELEVALGSASGPIEIDSKRLGLAKSLDVRLSDEELDDVPYSSERSAPGTRTVDFFELVGRVVDRVLAAGRYDEAATMLQSQLSKVLADARAGRAIPAANRDASLRYAILLGAGARDARWLDYALDLLTACACAPTQELAQDLEEAVASVGGVDEQRLARYVAAVDGFPEALERLRGVTLARQLQRVARRAR